MWWVGWSVCGGGEGVECVCVERSVWGEGVYCVCGGEVRMCVVCVCVVGVFSFE